MTDGPGGAGASRTIGRAKLAYTNFEPAIAPPRGFNVRERRRFAPRRREPYGNFRDALDRLQDGGEYCSGGEADAAAAVIEFAVELKRMP